MPYKVSRLELILRGAGYLFLGVAGLWVFANPPETFPGRWSIAVAAIWGTLLIPSFIAAVASFIGRYRVEMIVLPLIIGALLLYGVSVFYIIPLDPSHGAHGFVLLSFVAMLVSRFVQTMKLARRPPPPTTQEIPLTEKD